MLALSDHELERNEHSQVGVFHGVFRRRVSLSVVMVKNVHRCENFADRMLLIRKESEDFFCGGSPTVSFDLTRIRDQAAIFVLGSGDSVELVHHGLKLLVFQFEANLLVKFYFIIFAR